ncbi:helix-turn-helix domain-containing protein [Sphingomonas sp. 3-13AW]|uniref:helix-turn-helix domain-containing protein n=1 Tax=Sphingomonas sp. 3-13AW TaxID=3050450 RepID=UPI003BB658A5
MLDMALPLVDHELKNGTLLTRPLVHGELHASLPPLDAHVVLTYYGTAQKAMWRQGAQRVVTRTRRGSISLLAAGEDGHWDQDGPVEVSHVFLSRPRLIAAAEALSLPKPVELISRFCVDDPTTARILEILGKDAGSTDRSACLFVEQAVDLLCTQLIRSHSSHGVTTAQAPPRGLPDRQVKRVTDYMAASLDRQIGLDELAGLVGLSRFHFCTSLKAATGMTPHEWLTSLRMQRARELLATTDWPIIAIALEVGYQTPSAFAASFRKACETTPTAYRHEVGGRRFVSPAKAAIPSTSQGYAR